MGVGCFFPGEVGARVFLQNFFRGAKSGEICFFPVEIKKTTAFTEIFKIQRGAMPPTSPFRRPWLALLFNQTVVST